MTKTQTFSMWYGDFIKHYHAGLFPSQRLGQAFVNELHTAGKHTLANSLLYTNDDPFYSDEVSESCLAFIDRMWDWPQG